MSTGLTVVGSIQQLVDGRRVRALQEFRELAEIRLSTLEQHISDDEVAKIFERITWAVARDMSEEKSKIFASILASRYSGTLTDVVADTLASVVDELAVAHIHVLQAVRSLPPDDKSYKEGQPAMVSFRELARHINQTNIYSTEEINDLLVSWTSKLVYAGLLRTRLAGHKGEILMGVNPYGLMTMQAFRFSELGSRLTNMLDD